VLPHPNPSPGAEIFGQVEGVRFVVSGLAPGRYSVTAAGTDDGDSTLVTIEAGQVARPRLTSRGAGSVQGRVVEQPGGAPVGGAACHFRMRSGNGSTPHPLIRTCVTPRCYPHRRAGTLRAGSGAGGRDLHRVHPSSRLHATGGAALTLATGSRATVEIAVARRSDGDVDLGLELDRMATSPLVATVDEGSPAAAAGLRAGTGSSLSMAWRWARCTRKAPWR